MSVFNVKELLCKRVIESETTETHTDVKVNVKSTIVPKLSEHDACISEYLTQHDGFSGVIKQRFSDFHVHEIDLDGNIVRLTSFDLPEPVVESVVPDSLPEETWKRLDDLAANGSEPVSIDVTDFDKDKRKEIHQNIKAKFGKTLISNTKVEGNIRSIVVSKPPKGQTDRIWPQGIGKYLHFVLFKSNLDTNDAISILSSKLHTKPDNIQICGTKDKRGNTTQLASMKFLNPKRLQTINKFLRQLSVGNYVYKSEGLALGSLKGNHFDIVLRNVTASEEVIDTALKAIKEHGFLNYYGLQRFGNSRTVPTFDVGKALIKGHFEMAVELILKPREETCKEELHRARQVWYETKDAGQAFRMLKSKEKSIEGKLLSGLMKHGKKAYINALDCIPRNTRLLYLHSYQSFIWNKVLSRRVKTYGVSVLAGDLVLSEGTDSQVTHVTDVAKFRLDQVLHPLPGHSVTYPDNVMKEWYLEALQQDGLTLDVFEHSVKKYALSGSYRNIVKKAGNLTWRTLEYSHADQDLLLSDAELMEGKELEADKGDKKFKAVVLSLDLDSSTYATMFLREVLRSDTSASHQTSLNTYSTKRSLEDTQVHVTKKPKLE